MVRVTQPEQYNPHNIIDSKSQLVIDTFNIFQNSHFPCIHNHNNYNYNYNYNNTTTQSPFIDWYLILRVAEDASIATIRKQYHKLALLLHPDKNKHPKAEFAFKLISQAYKCLSEDAKRISFNLERWRNQCTQCSNIQLNVKTHHKCNTNNKRHSTNSTQNSRSCKIQQHFRTIREQLIEEAKVIDGCIRVNQGPKNEHPVFNPSSYMHLGYPHRRSHPLFYKKGASFRDEQTRNVVPNYDQRRSRCETPIFELRPDCNALNLNSACISS